MAIAARNIITSIGVHVTASNGCVFISSIITMACFSKKKHYTRIQKAQLELNPNSTTIQIPKSPTCTTKIQIPPNLWHKIQTF